MLTAKGGLKKKHADKTGFQSISDMIQAPGTTFKVLTVGSLKGYMIIMNVDEAYAEYFTMSDNNTGLTKTVTQYLLKFSITDTSGVKSLPDFDLNGEIYVKNSDDTDSYFLEAQLQSNLWWNSISGGKLPICPAVANISFFKSSAQNLLNAFIAKALNARQEAKLVAIRDYLLAQLNNSSYSGGRSIGLITQNLLEYPGGSAVTLLSVLDDNSVSQSIKRNLIIFSAAQVLRLYLDYKVVHCDLHLENILVSGNECFIIDFGAVYDIDSPSISGLSNVARHHADKLRVINSTSMRGRRNFDSNFIEDIFIDELVSIDKAYMATNFPHHAGEYQMESLINEINNIKVSDPEIYYKIYEKYRELEKSSELYRLTPATLKRYEEAKLIEKPNYNAYSRGQYSNIQFPTGPGAAAGQTFTAGQTLTATKMPNDKLLICVGAGVCILGVAIAGYMMSGGKHKRNKRCRTHKNCKTHKKR
jgi:hypothetical protein